MKEEDPQVGLPHLWTETGIANVAAAPVKRQGHADALPLPRPKS